MKNQNISKAQSGAEFIAYISITMFALTVLTAAISAQQQQVQQVEGSQQAEDAVALMKENLHLAVINQEGYERTFQLPRDINNNQYNLTITPGGQNGFIAVDWGHTEEHLLIDQTKFNPESDIKFRSQQGTEITIKHTEAGVEVEQD